MCAWGEKRHGKQKAVSLFIPKWDLIPVRLSVPIPAAALPVMKFAALDGDIGGN